jgi:hypothetical protein
LGDAFRATFTRLVFLLAAFRPRVADLRVALLFLLAVFFLVLFAAARRAGRREADFLALAAEADFRAGAFLAM